MARLRAHHSLGGALVAQDDRNVPPFHHRFREILMCEEFREIGLSTSGQTSPFTPASMLTEPKGVLCQASAREM